MNLDRRKLSIGQLILKLYGAWGRTPPAEALPAYEKALEGLELHQIATAVDDEICAGGDHPPSAGNLARVAKKVAPQPRPGYFLPPAEWKRDPAWDKPEVRDELAHLKASLRERGVLAVTLGVAERAMNGSKEANS